MASCRGSAHEASLAGRIATAGPNLYSIITGLVLLLTALQRWAVLRLLGSERRVGIVLSAVVLSVAGAISGLTTVLVVLGLILTLAGAVLMWNTLFLPTSASKTRLLRRPSGRGSSVMRAISPRHKE